jgi:enoyl-CoA hydratase/carnithine racemase
VAPSALEDAIERWVLRFEHTSRAAVAATKQILNLRFGSLLEESMQRETEWCVDLFDHPDCRAALPSFRER